MIKYTPDYTQCKDSRKEVYHSICKHLEKRTKMYCGLNKKECPAWKGYKYKD